MTELNKEEATVGQTVLLKPFGFGHNNKPVTKMVKPLRRNIVQEVINKLEKG